MVKQSVLPFSPGQVFLGFTFRLRAVGSPILAYMQLVTPSVVPTAVSTAIITCKIVFQTSFFFFPFFFLVVKQSVNISYGKSTPHALKGQKLLAQGIALGTHGRKPVAL